MSITKLAYIRNYWVVHKTPSIVASQFAPAWFVLFSLHLLYLYPVITRASTAQALPFFITGPRRTVSLPSPYNVNGNLRPTCHGPEWVMSLASKLSSCAVSTKCLFLGHSPRVPFLEPGWESGQRAPRVRAQETATSGDRGAERLKDQGSFRGDRAEPGEGSDVTLHR